MAMRFTTYQIGNEYGKEWDVPGHGWLGTNFCIPTPSRRYCRIHVLKITW